MPAMHVDLTAPERDLLVEMLRDDLGLIGRLEASEGS